MTRRPHELFNFGYFCTTIKVCPSRYKIMPNTRQNLLPNPFKFRQSCIFRLIRSHWLESTEFVAIREEVFRKKVSRQNPKLRSRRNRINLLIPSANHGRDEAVDGCNGIDCCKAFLQWYDVCLRCVYLEPKPSNHGRMSGRVLF